MTQQPEWRLAGSTGDVDPIAYGGGFIYRDATGVYPPEMTWFEPASDEEWKERGDNSRVTVYRVILEDKPEAEWWFDRLADVASFAGQQLEEMRAAAKSENLTERAWVYDSLIHYYGVEEFDSYPVTMTESEAYERFAEEMSAARKR